VIGFRDRGDTQHHREIDRLAHSTMTFSRTRGGREALELAVIRYAPGARFRNLNSPAPSVTYVCVASVPATDTVTPGSTPPCFVLDGAVDAAALNLRERGRRYSSASATHDEPIVSFVFLLCVAQPFRAASRSS